jgi:hypothetical protein
MINLPVRGWQIINHTNVQVIFNTDLGTIPQENFDYGNRNQVLMRFDLTPSWGQHDFFFVEFAPPEPPTE